MNDHRRDPFDLGLDFHDAVRPAPPTPWQAQRLDVAETAPPPPSQPHAPSWPADEHGSFPGTWPRGIYDSQRAADSWPVTRRHIDSEACGVVARSIEAQVLIPTARPSYKAGFDRRELKALAAAAVTGLTIAGAMAATLLHSSAPPPPPAAAVAVVGASAPAARPAPDEAITDEEPGLLAQAGQTADILAEAARSLPAPAPDIDLDLDEDQALDLDDAELDDEASEGDDGDAPRVSSSKRRSQVRSSSRVRSKRSKASSEKAKKTDEDEKPEKAEKPEPPEVEGPLKDFNANAARSALSRAAGAASGCGQPGGPSGRARVSVTFAPNGTVSAASVSAPFAGTATGRCIVGAFRGTTMTPFKGSSMSLSKSVFIRIPEGDATKASTSKSKKGKRKARRRRR